MDVDFFLADDGYLATTAAVVQLLLLKTLFMSYGFGGQLYSDGRAKLYISIYCCEYLLVCDVHSHNVGALTKYRTRVLMVGIPNESVNTTHYALQNDSNHADSPYARARAHFTHHARLRAHSKLKLIHLLMCCFCC